MHLFSFTYLCMLMAMWLHHRWKFSRLFWWINCCQSNDPKFIFFNDGPLMQFLCCASAPTQGCNDHLQPLKDVSNLQSYHLSQLEAYYHWRPWGWPGDHSHRCKPLAPCGPINIGWHCYGILSLLPGPQSTRLATPVAPPRRSSPLPYKCPA